MRFCSLVGVFAFSLINAIAPFASAGTIVDLSPNTDSYRIGGVNQQVEGMTWTQSGSYTGVNISAFVGATVGGPLTFDAYLSDATGPSAGAALYSATGLTAPVVSSGFTSVLLFNNLTLGAGTYYLTLYSTDADSGHNIRWATGSVNSSDTVATNISGSFANALPGNGTPDTTDPWKSTFLEGSNLAFTVTSVPEPSTFGLLSLGGIGLAIRRRRLAAI